MDGLGALMVPLAVLLYVAASAAFVGSLFIRRRDLIYNWRTYALFGWGLGFLLLIAWVALATYHSIGLAAIVLLPLIAVPAGFIRWAAMRRRRTHDDDG